MVKLTELPAASALTGAEDVAVLQGGEMRLGNIGGYLTGKLGQMEVLPFASGVYSHAIVDVAGNILAQIERATGKWKLALSADSPVDQGAVLGAMRIIDVSNASGWLFPILDAANNIVGGWRADGTFSAVPAPDFVAGASLDAVMAALAAANMGKPSGRLFFAGDSLFMGTDPAATCVPASMSAALGLPFVNTAVGGTRSGSIGVRMGGIAMNLTLAADLPAATTEVNVTVYSEDFTNNQLGQEHSGTLLGIPVILKRYGDAVVPSTTDHYTVRRVAAAGAATAIPAATRFLPAVASGNELDYHYIQAGRNDGRATRGGRVITRDNILRMIDHIGHDRFAVLAIKNGDGEGTGTAAYDQIMDANRLIEEAVGWHFCNQRKYLASLDALTDAGIAPTTQDSADIAADIPAASLRSDFIHGTVASYPVEGGWLARWHRGHGWATGI